jgi:hypothetical protein
MPVALSRATRIGTATLPTSNTISTRFVRFCSAVGKTVTGNDERGTGNSVTTRTPGPMPASHALKRVGSSRLGDASGSELGVIVAKQNLFTCRSYLVGCNLT